MADCQDRARDMIAPGMENNPSQVEKAQEQMLQCMSKAVDNQIGMLKPLKKRIDQQLKKL